MSIIENFEWKTKEGEKIFSQKWLVDGTSKAIFVLVHGLGEHIGRYNHVADFFNQHQISVYGFDHRGHGKSTGKRGHIGSSQLFMSDIDTLIDTVKKENPSIPIFLYGHSMGGNMVLYYTLNKKPALNGVISTSPAIGVGDPVPPIKFVAAKILKNLFPSFQMDNGLDIDNLSHNSQVIKEYKEDPLVHSMVSVKLALETLSNGDWILQEAEKFNIPLLLLQGEKDHLANLEKTKQLAAKIPESLITFKIFPELYHELHNELEQEQVFDFILDWINRQC
ncbi:MAG: lysophospholipase [Chloroflexi bacterium HGW-Chloroflexi-3]|nr:MAG: lysophospholipase [Chloroflexi bacterium HGW-Chloroflexi-3]